MSYIFLPPDGIVKGSIDSHTGTLANIWLNLSFCNAAPAGAFYTTIKTRDKNGLINKYTASSNCPIFVNSSQTGGVNSVKANFSNTIISNSSTNETVSNCRAFITSTQTQPGTWAGTLKIVYPDGRNLTVYGQFQGSVKTNRQVEGRRDNSCVAPGS